MNQMTNQFARLLLRRLGITPRPQVLRFLAAWGQAEGTSARYNPLGTTRDMPGATNFNSVGVKNYGSIGQGVEATARAITNGLYGNILTLMRAPGARAEAMATAVAASPWGTGKGVLRVLGSGPVRIPGGIAPVQDGPPGPMGAGAGGPATVAQLPVGQRLRLFHDIMQGSSGNVGAFTDIRAILSMLQTPGGVKVPTLGGKPSDIPGFTPGAMGAVSLSSTANLPGKPVKPYVLNFARRVAGIAGERLVIGTGTNHRELVSGTSRRSAHYYGNAVDIPATGNDLTKIGQAALVAAGIPIAKARKMRGGLYNIGHWQIIFNIDLAQGGNHYNHLHIGWRG